MWHTWNALPTRWNDVMRVILVLAMLGMSACTAAGRSSSTPAALSSEAGQAGAADSGNGGGY